MKRHWIVLVVTMLALVACGERKAALPTMEEEMQAGWINFGKDYLGNVWELYSDVKLDSNTYVIGCQKTFSEKGKEELNTGYQNTKDMKETWVCDTSLNQMYTTNSIYYDSVGKVLYSDNRHSSWDYITPETFGHSAATIAKMVYQDKTLKPTQNKYDVDYGTGDWVMYDKKNLIKYVNNNIVETDSSYIIWGYNLYRKYDWLVLEAFAISQELEKRLTYGRLFKLEYLKSTNKYRYLEWYCIDKFGDAFYKYEGEDLFTLNEDENGEYLKEMLSHRKE